MTSLCNSEEMNAQWDIPLHVETSLAAFVCNALPNQTNDSSSGGSTNKSEGAGSHTSSDMKLLENRTQAVDIGIPSSSNATGPAAHLNVILIMSRAFWCDACNYCTMTQQIIRGIWIFFAVATHIIMESWKKKLYVDSHIQYYNGMHWSKHIKSHLLCIIFCCCSLSLICCVFHIYWFFF